MKFTDEKITKRSLKDVFGSYLLKDAEFDINNYDIPFVEVPKDIKLPERLVSYSKIGTSEIDDSTFIHFYQDDYIFDGLYGVWNSLIYNHQTKKGFSLDKFADVGGVICPDYSLYGDFPEALKIWNTYRSRAFGSYINSIGGIAIPNFHANGPDSYEYCFGGLRKHTIVAVSTLGCLRSNADKSLFLQDTEELIKRIKPKIIILYGNKNKEVLELFKKYNQNYMFFPSDISEAFRGTSHGNESK